MNVEGEEGNPQLELLAKVKEEEKQEEENYVAATEARIAILEKENRKLKQMLSNATIDTTGVQLGEDFSYVQRLAKQLEIALEKAEQSEEIIRQLKKENDKLKAENDDLRGGPYAGQQFSPSNFSDYSQPAYPEAPYTAHPRDQVARNIKTHFEELNYVATEEEYNQALRAYGTSDVDREGNEEEEEEEGLNKAETEVPMAIPTQPWACWKEYTEEDQKIGILYDILRINGLLTKHVSWEKNNQMEEAVMKVREGLGLSGSLTIAGVCYFTIKVVLAVVKDDYFSKCMNSRNGNYIFGTVKNQQFTIDTLLEEIINDIKTKNDQVFSGGAVRNDLSTSEVRSLFLLFAKLLAYLTNKKSLLKKIGSDDDDAEIMLIDEFIKVVKNIPKSKSPLDMLTPSVLFNVTGIEGVNEIETVTADYLAGVGLAEFFPSVSETTIYISENAEKGGRPVSMPTTLLRGPSWIAFLVLIPKMFDPKYTDVKGNEFMTSFYNWRQDPRVIAIWNGLSQGETAMDDDIITYEKMKGNENNNDKPFYDICHEGSDNFNILASKLDRRLPHPSPKEEMEVEQTVTIYDLLMELGKDNSREFKGNIDIKLYRRAAFAGFCYQRSRGKVTLPMLTDKKFDYLGHDFDKLILALLLFSDGLKEKIHEWGYNKTKGVMEQAGSINDRITKFFERKQNVFSYDNGDLEQKSNALEKDNLGWTSVLTVPEASEMLEDIAKTLTKTAKTKWDSRKNVIPKFNKTGSQIYREEYEKYCSPEGKFIDPELVEQMFQNNIDKKSAGQPILIEGLKDIIAIQSTINAHSYEAELPMFGNVCTFLGYEQMDIVDGQHVDRGVGRCVFTNGSFFDDAASRASRQLNSQTIKELEKNSVNVRNLPSWGGPDSVCVRSTDLHFSLAGQSDISVMNSVGCIDAATYRVHKEKGYKEVLLGGMVPLYLDNEEVCKVFWTRYTDKIYDKYPDYIFPSTSLLVETNYWKLSNQIVVPVLEHMIDPQFKNIVLSRLQSQMREIIRKTYSESVELEVVNNVAAGGGSGGGSASLDEVVVYQKGEEIKSSELLQNTEGLFESFFISVSELLSDVKNSKVKFTSVSFKREVGAISMKLASDLEQLYTNNGFEDYKNAWLFGECINEAIDTISRFLQQPKKLFFPDESSQSTRKSSRGKGGARNEESQTSLQISEPSSESFETSSLVENKQQLSTTNNIITSVTNPVETGYGLAKPTLKIYKHINARGEISFEPVIQLFGDGSYGGYLGVSNGKSFLKIFTSNQEVDEYIESRLPLLQEYSEQKQLLLQDAPELTQVETKIAPELTLQEVPEKKPEEAPEEASGILSYLGFGGHNKSQRNRNRNKSRKVRKTKRRMGKSNKRSRKYGKIINHTKTKGNH